MPVSDHVVGVAPGNRWRLRSGRRSSAGIGCSRSVSLVALGSLPSVQSKESQHFVPAQEDEDGESDERQDQEEEDEQPVPQRRVFIVPGGSAVHAAAITFELTEGRIPAVVTVTVPVTVTHPVSMTFLLHVTVVVQNIDTATLKVHTNLVFPTLGSLSNHPRVGDI